MQIDTNEYKKKALFDELGPPSAGPMAAPPMAPSAPDPIAPPLADAPSAPDYTKRGQYGTFNATSDKYNRPWDQMSERYKMQTVLSNFDPNAGITPDVINALNKANINGATFSGSGDKLDARGLKNWENYDGREGIGDIIQGFKDPNNTNKTWGAWQPEEELTQVEMPQGGGGLAFGGIPLDGALNGDPLAKIQQAIQQLSGSRPNFDALLAELGGGQ